MSALEGTIKKSRSPGHRIPRLDKLIEQGATAEEIGKSGGYNPARQGGHLYITSTHQIPYWHERRQAAKSRKAARETEAGKILEDLVSILKAKPYQLVEILKARAYQLAEESGWAYEKAVSVFFSPKFDKYSLATLVELFERRQDAEKDNRTESLSQLGEGLMSLVRVGQVFNYAGVEPMYRKNDAHKTPTEKIKAMQRGFNLEISSADITYFLGLNEYVVGQRYSKIGGRPIYRPIVQIGNSQLTHRLASRIYQDLDENRKHNLGFSVEEIAQLNSTTERIVNYTISNRQILEPKIVEALRVLHGNNNINTPYFKG